MPEGHAPDAQLRTKVLALCGGVGGAKLALGLQHHCAGELMVAVNTGDDFVHLGLNIAPDIDTVMYTLSGLVDKEKGWGRAVESWNFMTALQFWQGETWFQLGDTDLALHVLRTDALQRGKTLSDVTSALCERAGVTARIVPMTNDGVHTTLHTSAGTLSFQHYFVRERCVPVVEKIEYIGADNAAPLPSVLEALDDDFLRAVIICPSNPYLSIGPMLALPALRRALEKTRAPVIVVSPIVAGDAVKGPTAKLMQEFDKAVDHRTVAEFYADIADGIIVDTQTIGESQMNGISVHISDTLMRSYEDKVRLAGECLAFADHLRGVA